MEQNKYLIKYPYTWTIILLITINALFLISFKNQIDWGKYLSTLFFTQLFGIAQIHGLENLGNIPAWIFPKGSSYFQDKNIKFFKNIIIEDILFIPSCSSLFYAFMFLSESIPDVLRAKQVIMIGLCAFLIIEALLYQIGGNGCRILMIAYTLAPIILLLVTNFNFSSINLTHAFVTLIFVLIINCGWELFNAHKKHWIYNYDCNLFSKNGWILNKKLHISIFIQYALSGFIVIYFCWCFF